MSRLRITIVEQSVHASKPLLAALEGYLALNMLTNYVNNVAQTDIDFPRGGARLAA